MNIERSSMTNRITGGLPATSTSFFLCQAFDPREVAAGLQGLKVGRLPFLRYSCAGRANISPGGFLGQSVILR